CWGRVHRRRPSQPPAGRRRLGAPVRPGPPRGGRRGERGKPTWGVVVRGRGPVAWRTPARVGFEPPTRRRTASAPEAARRPPRRAHVVVTFTNGCCLRIPPRPRINGSFDSPGDVTNGTYFLPNRLSIRRLTSALGCRRKPLPEPGLEPVRPVAHPVRRDRREYPFVHPPVHYGAAQGCQEGHMAAR